MASGLDRDKNGGVILLYIRGDIPLKLLSVKNHIETFFVEINLHKEKRLSGCSYNQKKALIVNHMAGLSDNIDIYTLTALEFQHFLLRQIKCRGNYMKIHFASALPRQCFCRGW